MTKLDDRPGAMRGWRPVLQGLLVATIASPTKIPRFARWVPPMVRSIYCWWSGHQLETVLFQQLKPPVRSVECKRCGMRFVVIPYKDSKHC
jgi:hypothetical protein